MSESLTKLSDGTWLVAGKNADGRWDTVVVSQSILDAYAASSVEAEMERCALLAEQHTGLWDNATAVNIAASIRNPDHVA